MGLILPALAAFALAVTLAWLFGGRKGPEALGQAVRRGGAGTLFAIGLAMTITGRVATGIPLIAIGLSIWRPRFLERKPWIQAGRVMQGRFAGRSLDQLGNAELAALYAEVSRRTRDRLVLEAYLDRRIPGWREHVEGDPAGRASGPTRAGTMTDEQAYQILGLSPGAAEAEISAAYRRLMKRVHPDLGGSTFLAAQINEAKERLLGRHR